MTFPLLSFYIVNFILFTNIANTWRTWHLLEILPGTFDFFKFIFEFIIILIPIPICKKANKIYLYMMCFIMYETGKIYVAIYMLSIYYVCTNSQSYLRVWLYCIYFTCSVNIRVVNFFLAVLYFSVLKRIFFEKYWFFL